MNADSWSRLGSLRHTAGRPKSLDRGPTAAAVVRESERRWRALSSKLPTLLYQAEVATRRELGW